MSNKSTLFSSYRIFFNFGIHRVEDTYDFNTATGEPVWNLPHRYLYKFFVKTLEFNLYKYYVFFNATKHVSLPNTGISFMGSVKKNLNLLNVFDKALIVKNNNIPLEKLKRVKIGWTSSLGAFFYYKQYKKFLNFCLPELKSFIFYIVSLNFFLKSFLINNKQEQKPHWLKLNPDDKFPLFSSDTNSFFKPRPIQKNLFTTRAAVAGNALLLTSTKNLNFIRKSAHTRLVGLANLPKYLYKLNNFIPRFFPNKTTSLVNHRKKKHKSSVLKYFQYYGFLGLGIKNNFNDITSRIHIPAKSRVKNYYTFFLKHLNQKTWTYNVSKESYRAMVLYRVTLKSKVNKKLQKSLSFLNTKTPKFTLTALKLNLFINTRSNFSDRNSSTLSSKGYFKPKFNLSTTFLSSKTLALSNYYVLYASIKQRPFMRTLTKEIVWNLRLRRKFLRGKNRRGNFNFLKSLAGKPWLSYLGSKNQKKRKKWKQKKRLKIFKSGFFKLLRSGTSGTTVENNLVESNKIEPMIWNSFKNKEQWGFRWYTDTIHKFSNLKRLKRLKKKYFFNVNSKANPDFFIRKRETKKFRFKNSSKYKNKTKWFDFFYNESVRSRTTKRAMPFYYEDRNRLMASWRKNIYIRSNRLLRGGRRRKNRFKDKVIRNIHTYTNRFGSLKRFKKKNKDLHNSYLFAYKGHYLLTNTNELSSTLQVLRPIHSARIAWTPYVKVFTSNRFLDYMSLGSIPTITQNTVNLFNIKILDGHSNSRRFLLRPFSSISKKSSITNPLLWKVLFENKPIHITKLGHLVSKKHFNFLKRRINKKFNFRKVKLFRKNKKNFRNSLLHKNVQLKLLHHSYSRTLYYFKPKNIFYQSAINPLTSFSTKTFRNACKSIFFGIGKRQLSLRNKAGLINKIKLNPHPSIDPSLSYIKKSLLNNNLKNNIFSKLKNTYYRKLVNRNQYRLFIWSGITKSNPCYNNLVFKSISFKHLKYMKKRINFVIEKPNYRLIRKIKYKLRRLKRSMSFKSITFKKYKTRKRRLLTVYKEHLKPKKISKGKKAKEFLREKKLIIKFSSNSLFSQYLSTHSANNVNLKKRLNSIRVSNVRSNSPVFSQPLTRFLLKSNKRSPKLKVFKHSKSLLSKSNTFLMPLLSYTNEVTKVTTSFNLFNTQFLKNNKQKNLLLSQNRRFTKPVLTYKKFSRNRISLLPLLGRKHSLFRGKRMCVVRKKGRRKFSRKVMRRVRKKVRKKLFPYLEGGLKLARSTLFLYLERLTKSTRFYKLQKRARKKKLFLLLKYFSFSRFLFLKNLKTIRASKGTSKLLGTLPQINTLVMSFKKVYDKRKLAYNVYKDYSNFLKSTVLASFIYKTAWLENYKHLMLNTLKFSTVNRLSSESKVFSEPKKKYTCFLLFINSRRGKKYYKEEYRIHPLFPGKLILTDFFILNLSLRKFKVRFDNPRQPLSTVLKWTNLNDMIAKLKFLANPKPSLIPTDFLLKRGLLMEYDELSLYQKHGYLVSRTKTSFILSATGFFLLDNPPHYAQREEISPLILTSKYYVFWEPNDLKRKILNRVLRKYISIRKPLLNKFWSYNSRPGSITHDFGDVNSKKFDKMARRHTPHKRKKLFRSNLRLSQRVHNRFDLFNTTFSNFFNLSEMKMYNVFNTSTNHKINTSRFYHTSQSRDYWSRVLHKKLDLRAHKFKGNKRPRRYKFKPGIQRVLRRRRTGYRDLWQIRWFYEHRLTRYLGKQEAANYRTINTTLHNDNSQLSLAQILLYSKFLPDTDSVATTIKSKAVTINGYFVTSPNSAVILNDFIQMVIHAKYYIIYKWIVNWSFKVVNRIAKMNKRRPVYKKVGLFKKRSHRIPNWIYNYRNKYRFYDIYRYLEVDYFTLSSFIIYDPWRSAQKQTHTDPHLFRTRITRLYNWRYIT